MPAGYGGPARKHPAGLIGKLMKLTELLSPERVLPNIAAETPWQAMEELIDHLIAEGRVGADRRESFLTALHEREEQVSTGIGFGVAIPHAYCGTLSSAEAVLGRSVDGIEFESPDNAPVHFIILLLVPENQAQSHLQTLAAVAGVFSIGEVREQLKDAESPEDLISIIAASENSSD